LGPAVDALAETFEAEGFTVIPTARANGGDDETATGIQRTWPAAASGLRTARSPMPAVPPIWLRPPRSLGWPVVGQSR